MPKVLNKFYDKIPSGAVNIMRPTKWGNPYIIGTNGTRHEVIELYAKYILPKLDVSELRGKDLVCCCKPLACHGDVLLKAANEEEHHITYGRLEEESALRKELVAFAEEHKISDFEIKSTRIYEINLDREMIYLELIEK